MELNIYAGNIKLEMKSCPTTMTTWTNGDMSAKYTCMPSMSTRSVIHFIFHNPIALPSITIFVFRYIALRKGTFFAHPLIGFYWKCFSTSIKCSLHNLSTNPFKYVWISLKSIALIAIDHLYFKILTLFYEKKGENCDDYFRVVYVYKWNVATLLDPCSCMVRFKLIKLNDH